ncbi:MAG TPA: tryptophan-rich sensory protein [Clostridia bacterium]|nr:tryptophan-rich sensory protein [Clostridia bacterium]HQM39293.1 tryptophan-rich sensory protein [Clostridia bacterium]
METNTKKYSLAFKMTVAVSFVVMVIINAIANIIPINNITTGEVSDSYPNLFAPSGVTFSIWGVIYLLLTLYCLYQFGIFQKKAVLDTPLYYRVGTLFIISSVTNAAWIFAWHYKALELSLVLMLIILISLILINSVLVKADLTVKDKTFLRLPFSIYYGWITVATIANVTAYLVEAGWDRFGLSEVFWTIAIITSGLLIGGFTAIINKDIPYILVFIWAYTGIIIKHISVLGFNSAYPSVIIAASVAITLLIVETVYIVIKIRKI